MSVPYDWTVYVRLQYADGSTPNVGDINQIVAFETGNGRADLTASGMNESGMCTLKFGRETFYPPRLTPTLTIEVRGTDYELLHEETFSNVNNLSTLTITISGTTIDTWRVYGRVTDNGEPVTSGLVQAFDTYHSPDKLLNQIGIDSNGNYNIQFDDNSFGKSAEHPVPNLEVRAIVSGLTVGVAGTNTPNLDQELNIEASIPNELWNITGVVLQACGVPLVSGRIQAVDRHDNLDTLLYDAQLDAEGGFGFSFQKSDFQVNGATHEAPDLQILVFDITGTSRLGESPMYPSVGYTKHILFQIEEEKKNDDEDECDGYKVFGNVLNQVGLPVQGVEIKVIHLYYNENESNGGHHLSEKELARGVSDGRGHYEIRYAEEHIEGGNCACCTSPNSANLIVEAFETTTEGGITKEDTLYRSPLNYQAEMCQEVDLRVNSVSNVDRSEFVDLTTALEKCLGPSGIDEDSWWQGIRVIHGDEAYLSFVSKTIDWSESLVLTYVRSYLLYGDFADKLSDIPDLLQKISPELIYGLVRGGLPDELSALLGIDAVLVFETLISSIDYGYVSFNLEVAMPEFLEAWRAILIALSQYTGSEGDEAGWQKKLLETAIADESLENRILELNFDNEGDFNELCDELSQSGELTDEQVENFRFAFELYDITGRYMPLTELLINEKKEGSGGASNPYDWHSVEDLAELGIEDTLDQSGKVIIKGWAPYLRTIVNDLEKPLPDDLPGTTNDEKISIYAARMKNALHEKSPQKRFVHRMGVEAAKSVLTPVPVEDRFETSLSDVYGFLNGHPVFSLESDNIDNYESQQGISINKNLKKDIKTCQRMYRLTTEFSAFWSLFNDAGFDSAFTVSNVSEARFLSDYENELGGPEKALSIYRTAENFSVEVLALVARFHQSLNNTGGGKALQSGFSPEAFEDDSENGMKKFPNWITLFGDFNKCACKHCQTVFSPAAYLTDLLEYISETDRTTTRFDFENEKNVTLNYRRDDLPELELTCPNTNKMLPYIDLVNELLELKIWPYFRVAFNDEFSDPDNDTNRQAIQEKLGAWGYVLTETAEIEPITENNIISTIRDDAYRFHVWKEYRDENEPHYVVKPFPQTSRSSDDLEVYPEHIHNIIYENIEAVDPYNPDRPDNIVTFYGVLNNARFPFCLPFDLGMEEVQILLDHKKTELSEIKETFYRQNTSPDDNIPPENNSPEYLGSETAAFDYLRLNKVKAGTIRGAGVAPWILWGLEETGNILPRPDKPTVIVGEGNGGLEWKDVLSMMPFFLHRSGLSYEELLDLLETTYMADVKIYADDTAVQECNFNEYRLVRSNGSSLNENALLRFSFFIRLWRHLGWTMKEVDIFLIWLERPSGSNPFNSYRRLHYVKRISELLNVPVLEVVSWWAEKMDHHVTERLGKTLFEEVFLVGNRDEDEYEELEKFCSNRHNTGHKIDLRGPAPVDGDEFDFEPIMRAALGVDAETYQYLLERESQKDENPIDLANVTLVELTQLYRIVSLCRAVDISVDDYYALQDFFGNINWKDPFDLPRGSGEVPNIFGFLKILKAINASSLSISALSYIFCHKYGFGAPELPTDDTIKNLVLSLNQSGKKIDEAFPVYEIGFEDADVVVGYMKRLLPEAQQSRLISLMTKPSGELTVDDYLHICNTHLSLYMARFPGSRNTVQDFIRLTPLNRIGDVWKELRPYLIDQEKDSSIYDILSEFVSLRKDTTSALLTDYLRGALEKWRTVLEGGWVKYDSNDDDKDMLTAWMIPPKDGLYQIGFEGVDPDITSLSIDGILVVKDCWKKGTIPGAQNINCAIWTGELESDVPYEFKADVPVELSLVGPNATSTVVYWKPVLEDWTLLPNTAVVPFDIAAFTHIWKSAMIINGLKLDNTALAYIHKKYGTFFNRLPTEIQDLNSGDWASFVDLTLKMKTASRVELKTVTAFELWGELIGVDDSPAINRIADETGWKNEEIVLIKNICSNSSYDDIEFWQKLLSANLLATRFGVTGKQLDQFTFENPPYLAIASKLRNIYKSQYSPATWKDAFKAPRDKLRQKQRDALTAYCCTHAIGNYGGKLYPFDENDLYSHFLIDVEMEPDTLTSRVKLAISSIQLFIQRVFLGLESDEMFEDLDVAKERWKWMKNYRVWEANRKVFLYPENWIEPELRDDKTEFFKELENALRQDDLSEERVKFLMSDYLEKVNDVSGLEVVGCFREMIGVEDEGLNSVLYVIGRTKSEPFTYYHRTFIERQPYEGEWTPWKKISLDISAKMAVPAVFNKRLYIFWLILQNKKTEIAKNENIIEYRDDIDVTPPETHTDIKLVWSEYVLENDKWSKPQISKKSVEDSREFVSGEEKRGEPNEERYHIRIDKNVEDYIVIVLYTSLLDNMTDASCISYRGRFIKMLGKFHVWENSECQAIPFHYLSNLEKLTLVNNDLEVNCLDGVGFQSNFALEDTLFFDINDSKNQYEFDQLQFRDCRPNFRSALERYRVLPTNFGFLPPVTFDPGFFITPTKTFFYQNLGLNRLVGASPPLYQRLKFETFNNPQIRAIQKIFMTGGPKAIMDRKVEALPVADNFYYTLNNSLANAISLGYWIAGDLEAEGTMKKAFEAEFQPSYCVSYPKPTVDFEYGSSFGIYNWELFFHVPLLIADRLTQEMKYRDAMDWLHFIFDPKQTLNNSEICQRYLDNLPEGARYWNFLPFFANRKVTRSLQQAMGLNDEDENSEERRNLAALIDAWKDDPFNPHLIARDRIVAYQKTVVMKYLDNLIAWADQLFRQDSFESINEATQLYIMAAEILGDRPVLIEPDTSEKRSTYRELKEEGIQEFSNTVLEVENLLFGKLSSNKKFSQKSVKISKCEVQSALIRMFYFKIPMNEKLLTYWDTVQDRLFKIRNSMNIDGVKRTLALFQPPIDPGLLVRAAAGGLDLSAVLAQMNAPMPHYRFNTWMQKATELTNELKSFSAAILSALEKKDAEALQLVRSDHEIRMLNLMTEIKKRQIDEADNAIEGLNKSKALAKERYDEYRNRKKISNGEYSQMALTERVSRLEISQSNSRTLAGALSVFPQLDIGTVTPLAKFTASFGGVQLSAMVNAGASATSATANKIRANATRTGTLAGYDRRWEDWKLQERLAKKEMEQLDTQILGAEIRRQIAEKELSNHEVQIENAIEVKEYMEDKFTNKDLYQWMISQLSSTYRDIYKMAFDTAKMAEKTYQFELGIENTGFIKFGYMDSLRKGLLAGEALIADLKRMELSYLEKNRREFEITKPISLCAINASALQDLKTDGYCNFELPEVLFDLDFAGQYFRRIKSVRLSIPCVTGPNVSVNAKLSLLSSYIRKSTDSSGEYGYRDIDDPRFIHDPVAIQSIATGSAQNDAGLFELNFRDERYLPFEGAGVISRWRLELPHKDQQDDGSLRQFDYGTISDVIMTLSYTARDGGGSLKEKAQKSLEENALNHIREIIADSNEGLIRIFSLREEFPEMLHKLLGEREDTKNQMNSVELEIDSSHFPFILRKGFCLDRIVGEQVDFIVQSQAELKITKTINIDLGGKTAPIDLAPDGGYSRITLTGAPTFDDWCSTWTLQTDATKEDVKNILIVLNYLVKKKDNN